MASRERKDAAKPPWMRGLEGRPPKREPSPEGLGPNPKTILSAVGAALNMESARTWVLRRKPTSPGTGVEGSEVLATSRTDAFGRKVTRTINSRSRSNYE
jgi:hypothetical protein